MKKTIYWLLTLTWGLPNLLLSLLITGGMLVFYDCRAFKREYGWYIGVGQDWSGQICFGPMSINAGWMGPNHCQNWWVSDKEAIKAALLGPFAIFFVTIPNVVEEITYAIEARRLYK